MKYSFLAQQYGTTWYHSHFTAQYGNGVVGTVCLDNCSMSLREEGYLLLLQIQIEGPASLPYDIDLGVLPISDYYYEEADRIVIETMNAAPPLSDNILINGSNINPLDPSQGTYSVITLTSGKTHRLRIINTSQENYFAVTIVGHEMTIIAADLVPVDSQTVDMVFLGVGQRYDVIITANQPVGNYWLNVTLSSSGLCGGSVNPFPAAIVRYAGAPDAQPTTQGVLPADAQTDCMDLQDLTPVVARTAPVDEFISTYSNANILPVMLDTTGGTDGVPLFRWRINGTQIDVDWGHPSAEYIMDGQTVPQSNNPVTVNGNAGQVCCVGAIGKDKSTDERNAVRLLAN